MPKKQNKKVDLYTYEEPLFDLIIGQYPNKISNKDSDSVDLENECYLVDDGDRGILYSLFNLNYSALEKILKTTSREYEIRDSKTGEFIKIKSIPKKLGREHLS
jgi:hypothetical protein